MTYKPFMTKGMF